MLPPNRTLASLCCATAVVLGGCRESSDRASDLLRRVIEHREAIPRAEWTTWRRIAYLVSEQEELGIEVIECSGVYVTSDGERLPPQVRVPGIAVGDDALDVSASQTEARYLWALGGYIFVPEEVRALYRYLLVGGSGTTGPESAVNDLIQAEVARCTRDFKDCWRSWAGLEQRLTLIRRLAVALHADETTRKSVDDMLERVSDTGERVRSVQRQGSRGLWEDCVLAPTIYGPGMPGLLTKELLRASGLLDTRLRASDVSRFEAYWDSRLLTRYVEPASGRRFRVIPLGELVQDAAEVVCGKRVSREEFVREMRSRER